MTQSELMRTIEFKIYPTPEQETKLNDCLLILRWVWNKALRLMQDFTLYNPYCKQDKQTYPAMPLYYFDERERQYKLHQIPQWQLDQDLVETKKGMVYPVFVNPSIMPLTQLPTNKKIHQLTKIFTQKHFSDQEISYQELGDRKLKFSDCPSKFVQGKLMDLAGTWIEFVKRPKEVKPARFKNSKNPIKSLIHYNADQISFDWENETFTPHKSIGKIKISGLKKRLPKPIPFNPLKVCKKASGWYLQLTVKVDLDNVNFSGLSTGIDIGKLSIFSMDRGHGKTPPRPLFLQQKRLKKLQRKLSRKGRINNANRANGEPYIKSNNWLKDSKKLAKLHEKIARSRRSFNHYFSTLLTDWFDIIFLGDYKSRLAKAKKKEIVDNDGNVIGYAQNGQARQRGVNKSTADIAIGQFIELLSTKATEKGKVVYKVNEFYTSQMCPACGKIQKKTLSQRTHKCDCGFTLDRDICSGINIKLKGIATLLKMSDKELKAIPNLDNVSGNNIRKKLKDEQSKVFDEYPAIKINHWINFLEIGSAQYLEHNTTQEKVVIKTVSQNKQLSLF